MEAPKVRNFYAVKVTGGQEISVAIMLEERIKTNGIGDVYSIIVPPGLKGYVIVESSGPHVVKFIIAGIRHVRGVAPGLVPKDDIMKMVSKKQTGPSIKTGDMVEVVSGPFRGMQAQVMSYNADRGEVVLNILESAFPLQVTIPVDQIRPVKKT
ncbi:MULTISPECIES: transcription elongation factor Spt5 [Metallosphaera]|uniref:Transcription elongation factor Spt5 n=3 Tax=Metallosphaera TaxID=41980 RepID=A4YH86_METS5|nr:MULTISPECIES: transcription elongation factor Spt5 [Metallosphaera]ABP95788.1 LSU ribosomal protein L24A [Metallosphaera sedula DSM 5348]AIM27772.1 LSU ribosomal protein L24A [Metallosphaera sedula]AKV74627.1 antitermination protein NusG [Metallosphaera sedula]AKV76865.1 antitermination protein NusG [Metallosphaera sedula]AKV79116.1 antitermination protein NusG [Metallosphaera sedula]